MLLLGLSLTAACRMQSFAQAGFPCHGHGQSFLQAFYALDQFGLSPLSAMKALFLTGMPQRKRPLTAALFPLPPSS